MYHSINLTPIQNENAETINTYDNWHIVATKRPSVVPPKPKTDYVEIPGRSGALDYTDALTGETVYGNREGSWEFVVLNGYREWNVLYNYLLSYLHGKRFKVCLEDDPDYTYEGRLSINEWRSDPHNSYIVIDYVLDPHKAYSTGNISDWKWDDLSMGEGYIVYYGTFDVNGSRLRDIYNPSKESVELTLNLTSSMVVNIYSRMNSSKWLEGNPAYVHDTRNFTSGLKEHTGIFLEPGTNILEFVGTGRVIVNYDRGDIV